MTLKSEIAEQIKDLLKQNPSGLSITAIVRQIPINRNTAGRYLENLMVSGQVEMRHFGMAKIYRLAQRIPLSAMLSISSELIMLLDNSRRVIYANEPMLAFLGSSQKDLYGKCLEFTPCATVFDDAFDLLKKRAQTGISGKEWSGEVAAGNGTIIFACKIAPAVFEEGQRGVSILLENITERRQTERRIEESERQFRLLAENTMDIISLMSPDGTNLYVSPAITTISGYSPREIIGKIAQDFVHPDDLPFLRHAVLELTVTGPSVAVSYRCRHKEGHYVWVESLFRAVFEEHSGRVTEVYAVTRDITDRVAAEEALRESEDRYRTLVEFSPDAILLHKDGRIIYLNPAGLRLLGAAHPEMVIGKEVLDIIHPRFRDRVRHFIEKDLQGAITPPTELTLLRLDGTSVPVEGRGVRTSIGGSPAIQVTLQDITERKNVEKALRQSEETLRSIAENSPDMILLTDLEGKILFINRPITLTLDQVLLKTVFDFIPGEYQKAAASCFERVRATGKPAVYLTEYHFPSGITTIYESTVGPVVHDGEVVALVINARDITERISAEEAVRKSSEQYRMLSEASHDLIFVIDRTDRVEYVNSHAAAMLGIPADQIIGRIRSSLFPPGLAERQTAGLSRVFETGKPVRSEGIMPVDGDQHWFDHLLMPIMGEDGRVVSVLGVSRDITDRKQTETALRESEKRLITSQRIARVGDITWDLETGTATWSDGVYGLLGYDRAETTDITRVYAENHHPEDRDRVDAWLNESLASGSNRIPPNEYRIIREDGKVLFVHAEGEIQYDGGTPVRMTVTLQDITERKEAEDDLRQSEERYQTLVSISPDAIIVHRADGRIVYANKAASALVGLEDSGLMIGRSMYDFIDPEETGTVRTRLSSLLQGKPLSEGTRGTFVRTDGERIIGETTGTLIDFDGRPAILVITRDVTARIRAEESLRESEKRFRVLADLLPQNVWECDREGRLTFVNRRGLEMYGYSPEDFSQGIYIWQTMHPDDRTTVMSDFCEALAKEPLSFPKHHEYTALRKDGSTFPVIMYHVPIVHDNRIVGMRGIGIDCTEQKRMEDALQETIQTFQTIAENTVDIISRIGIDGTCIYVSPAVRWNLGYDPEEVIGRSALDYVHPDDLGRVLESIQKFGANGTDTGTDTFRMRHKDGLYSWFDATIRAIRGPAGGQVKEFIMVSRSSDLRKKFEAGGSR